MLAGVAVISCLTGAIPGWAQAGVCDRTAQVRDELVAEADAENCESVTDDDLAEITLPGA